MTPEGAAFIEKSREFIAKARGMLANKWPDEAGRAAYLAGPHAAKAFIFEHTGEMTKSHKRVQSEFGRLTRDDARFDTDLRAFLGRAYNLKALADYETGPESFVSAESAQDAIGVAVRLVDRVTHVLSAEGPPPTDR